MAGPNKTEVKRRKTKKKSYSSSKKGETKAQRKETYTSEASAEPKTPSKQPTPSQKRPRPKSPATAPPSSAKKRTGPAPLDEAFDLAGRVIRACPKDYWWRVTPDSSQKDDICVGSKEEWSNVLPVLVRAGLLDTKMSYGMKCALHFHRAKWQDMVHHLDRDHNIVMHLSTYHPFGKKRSHYFCIQENEMTADDLFDSISQFYGLSEFVSDRLEIYFPDYKENGDPKANNRKYRVVKGNEVLSSLEQYKPDSGGQKVKVELGDLRLGVRYRDGDKVTNDVSCDSKWMLETMGEVAQAIRAAYHWIPADQIIYLVMDNAGGHGTDKAVEAYTKQLLDEHKIEIIQQVPRSPETNVLDLGIWMSLQSAVEKEHRNMRHDANALNETVMRVWDAVASEDAFKNVFGKLPVIYANIKNNRGGNNLVESNRGKAGKANLAAQEADRNGEEDEGTPLWTLAVFEDEDMDGGEVDGVEDDEGVINLL